MVVGNAGVARTAVGELAYNANLDQGRTFSLFGLCSAIGYVIGPILGGSLFSLSKRHSLRGPAGLFYEYPCLLPCIVSSCYNLGLTVISGLYLSETRQWTSRSALVIERSPEESPEERAEEESALLTGHNAGTIPKTGAEENMLRIPSVVLCVLGMMLALPGYINTR